MDFETRDIETYQQLKRELFDLLQALINITEKIINMSTSQVSIGTREKQGFTSHNI